MKNPQAPGGGLRISGFATGGHRSGGARHQHIVNLFLCAGLIGARNGCDLARQPFKRRLIELAFGIALFALIVGAVQVAVVLVAAKLMFGVPFVGSLPLLLAGIFVFVAALVMYASAAFAWFVLPDVIKRAQPHGVPESPTTEPTA